MEMPEQPLAFHRCRARFLNVLIPLLPEDLIRTVQIPCQLQQPGDKAGMLEPFPESLQSLNSAHGFSGGWCEQGRNSLVDLVLNGETSL